MARPARRPFPTFLVAPTLFATVVIATATAVSAEKSFSVPAWGEARTATVAYSDLDLHTAAGAKRLEHRIAFAVEQVCAVPYGPRLSERACVAECRAFALSQANARAKQLLREHRPVARSD